MSSKSILSADGEYEFRAPTNQLEALGEACLLAEYTQLYGRMPVATLTQRFMTSAVHGQAYTLYQKTEGLPDVAVGFMLIGLLTPQLGRLYAARNRDLHADEVTGGSELWVLDMATPFGHYKIMKSLLHKAYPDHDVAWGLRKGVRTSFPDIDKDKTPETDATATAEEVRAIPVIIEEPANGQ